ncbi:hypothetical protein PARC_a2913 [Pseudoalteromonas arctica A 37-1-2]|uniref:Uncharacterized protein n=1 Tax=Pseudoalteromonas arctica A 37-1-2 TaxID=1117313 RepID=A0A290S5K2_9GAMM|nr:hypothetical protein PARC_a2913 [Pseudoalteromonas arctica A 37-1-2]
MLLNYHKSAQLNKIIYNDMVTERDKINDFCCRVFKYLQAFYYN